MNKTSKYLIIGLIVIVLVMSSSNVYASLSAFLKRYEESNKAALIAYDDGTNTPTIGWGSIYNFDENRPVEYGDTIDQATADRWLQIEATQKLTDVKNMVKVPITNNQLVALASFAYNEGSGALQGSTLLKLLNSGADKTSVAAQFDRWVYSKGSVNKGLINRRNAEKTLFLS